MKFENSKKALKWWKETEASRLEKWELAMTDSKVASCKEEDRKALEKVQLAFHKDTKDINSLENCKLVTIEFVNLCCKNSENKPCETCGNNNDKMFYMKKNGQRGMCIVCSRKNATQQTLDMFAEDRKYKIPGKRKRRATNR